jgi:hypothetical protein
MMCIVHLPKEIKNLKKRIETIDERKEEEGDKNKMATFFCQHYKFPVNWFWRSVTVAESLVI